MSDFILYKDEQLKEPFVIENIGKVDAGDTKLVKGFLKNETDFTIEQINYETLDEDLFLQNLPTELDARDSTEIQIGFNPKESRQIALNAFVTITGKKVIPPE